MKCEVRVCNYNKAEGDKLFCPVCRIRWKNLCKKQEWTDKTNPIIIHMVLEAFKNA